MNAKKKTKQPACLSPSATVLVKLGSIAVHADEYCSRKGHDFDRIALEQLLEDAEVKAWIAEMNELAMLPVKR